MHGVPTTHRPSHAAIWSAARALRARTTRRAARCQPELQALHMADRLRPPGPPGGAFSPAVALRGAPGPQLRRRSRGWVSGRRTVHPLADEGRRAAETMLARATDPSFLPTRSPRTTFLIRDVSPGSAHFTLEQPAEPPRPADTKSCQRTTLQPPLQSGRTSHRAPCPRTWLVV